MRAPSFRREEGPAGWNTAAAGEPFSVCLHFGEIEMTKRFILVGMISALLLGGSGCCVLSPIVHRPFGPGTACNPEHCGPVCPTACATCEPGIELPYERVRPAPCDSFCPPDCGPPCGRCGPCGPRFCGPLSLIFALLSGPTWCGDGCGEIYWGDFHGDPPDCCDPCDCHGNYTGVNTGPCGCGYESPASCTDCGPTGCASTGHGLVSSPGRVSGMVVKDVKVGRPSRVARASRPSAR